VIRSITLASWYPSEILEEAVEIFEMSGYAILEVDLKRQGSFLAQKRG